jgi:inositol oxygenase
MLAVQSYQRTDDPAGRHFDSISDAVDQINVDRLLAQQAKAESNAYEKARFDEDKDRESFRNFAEDSHAKLLYTFVVCSFSTPSVLLDGSLIQLSIAFFTVTSEQHAKQTVDFNIKARKKAFEKPRAVMGIWEAMEVSGSSSPSAIFLHNSDAHNII